MRFVKRYRRVTTTRALKPWTPVFMLDGHEVATTFTGGRVFVRGYRLALSAFLSPREDGEEANDKSTTLSALPSHPR